MLIQSITLTCSDGELGLSSNNNEAKQLSSRMVDQETWEGVQVICWPRSISSRSYDRIVAYETPVTRSKATVWTQLLWRKLKKEKKRLFQCSKSMRFTYDSYAYSQNFDQGTTYASADDISRSFSARFAVPSRFYENNKFMV